MCGPNVCLCFPMKRTTKKVLLFLLINKLRLQTITNVDVTFQTKYNDHSFFRRLFPLLPNYVHRQKTKFCFFFRLMALSLPIYMIVHCRHWRDIQLPLSLVFLGKLPKIIRTIQRKAILSWKLSNGKGMNKTSH